MLPVVYDDLTQSESMSELRKMNENFPLVLYICAPPTFFQDATSVLANIEWRPLTSSTRGLYSAQAAQSLVWLIGLPQT